MKKRAFVVAVAVLLLAVGVPAFANQCPTLIKQANDQIASMDQNSEKVKKANGRQILMLVEDSKGDTRFVALPFASSPSAWPRARWSAATSARTSAWTTR